MTHRIDHTPFLVPPGSRVCLADHDPGATAGIHSKKEARKALLEDVTYLAEMQRLLWASDQVAVLIIFQALDAAGKDGAIRHVMSGVNPQGVDVYSFKAPTDEERLRPFLWRPARVMPARGRIAIFNRSYYEEVLVVRVHPEWLEQQWLPPEYRDGNLDGLWQRRFDEINAFEQLMIENGIVIIKFFLNVSRKEQRKRFLERLDNPEKHWKFSASDIAERRHWDEYMHAYGEMLSHTSTEAAPWYIIPADHKWFTRACVADIIAGRIEDLDLAYPEVTDAERSELAAARKELNAE
ncbi:MAG: polyphosphate kinase 2 family protein [Maioricimonas sp. JB045]|uniref:polyphosphate kinase 2 family protein n=1 Tax=Maioricimonas sp. JC845 TaxID=3232138 RepID=UPI00345A52CB